MKKKLLNSMRVLLVAAGLCVGVSNAWAYDTPDGYKVGTVYVGHEVNNQVLAETFANTSSLSSAWSLSNTLNSNNKLEMSSVNPGFGKPAIGSVPTTLTEYTATPKAGGVAITAYSSDAKTYYSDRAGINALSSDDYNFESKGTTAYSVPTYVVGKCILAQPRGTGYAKYTLNTAVSSGKLVLNADLYASIIANHSQPIYIKFFSSSDEEILTLNFENGSNNFQYSGVSVTAGNVGYDVTRSSYRTYCGYSVRDVVLDLDDGTASVTLDCISDVKNGSKRTQATASSISFGTGKNIAYVQFYRSNVSSTNQTFYIDNMSLYTLVSGTASTSDMTFIGSKDYEDGYLGSTSGDYVIKPNGKLHLQFKNYGSGAYTWNNWIALFTNADKSTDLAYVRADKYDIESSSSTGITTSDNYWDDFQSDMFGSTVVMDITRTGGNVNMVATITTAASEELSLTFDKAIGNAAEDIVFRLSEDAACLVLDNTKTTLVAPPSFTQTGITNAGNPVITVTENALIGNTTSSYYTTDGSTPSASSTSYSTPVTVTGGNTIKAVTVATAADGTTTLTSNEGSLTTTEYVAAQTYNLTSQTQAEIYAQGFSDSNNSVDYGVGSTKRYAKDDGKSAVNILGGLTTNYNGSSNTWWYWMLGQGIWQSGGTRSVSLINKKDGEVALFTQYDCRYNGTSWTYTEADNYEEDCSFTLNKSNNSGTEGNHVYMLKKVQSFVPSGTTVSATIASSTGYATFSSPYAVDFRNEAELTVYKAKVNGDKSSVVLTAIDKEVPANTGVILAGSAVTYTGTVIASATAVTENDLLASTNNTAKINDYILVEEDSKAVFAPMSGGSLATGKAYLPATTVSGAKNLKIIFDDETLGINDTSLRNGNAESMGEKTIYNLSGQRIAAPQKGINIIGGRKVVVK